MDQPSPFKNHAPLYWAKGISAIPIIARQKRPCIDEWEQFQDRLPTEQEQKYWLETFGDSNIGMALGPASGIMVVDIDTTDPMIEDAIMKVLPKTPWKRVGAKGCVLAFKYNGQPSKRIKDKDNHSLVEILSSGTQVVLPPSIHPDSDDLVKNPDRKTITYVANCELYDVIDLLPKLPEDTEDRLRGILAQFVELKRQGSDKFNSIEFIPMGARDTKMVQHAGHLSRAILRGEISVLAAISDMQAWCEARVSKVAGDPIDERKGIAKILEFLLIDVEQKQRTLPVGWDQGMDDDLKKQLGLDFGEDAQEWTCEQIMENLQTLYTSTAAGDPNLMIGVELMLKKMAKSHKLTELEKSKIFKFLSKKDGLAEGKYAKRYKELSSGPVKGLNHTDIANAAIKDLERKGYMLRSYNGEFWTWEGSHWKIIDPKIIWDLIATEYSELPAASRYNDFTGIIKLIEKILPEGIHAGAVDGINFSNGFLTKDLRLIPHQPEFGMTYILPFNYDPSKAGAAFKFNSLLETSWGHNKDFAEKKLALREAIAATLFGMGPTFRRAILLHGLTGTGKSQILNIVSSLIPDEAKCSINPQQWGDRFLIAHLSGKLFNSAGELDKVKLIPDREFKMIVGGDEMTAHKKYQDPFEFRPKAVHWFAANFKPRSKDTTRAFSNRWLVLDFDKPLADKDKVLDFWKIIVEEEMEAMVAWAIEAFPALLKRKDYTLPESHVKVMDKMMMENSVIREWMKERVIDLPEGRIEDKIIYQDFWNFCLTRQHGGAVTPPSQFHSDFYTFLCEESRGQTVDVNQSTVYLGIALRPK